MLQGGDIVKKFAAAVNTIAKDGSELEYAAKSCTLTKIFQCGIYLMVSPSGGCNSLRQSIASSMLELAWEKAATVAVRTGWNFKARRTALEFALTILRSVAQQDRKDFEENLTEDADLQSLLCKLCEETVNATDYIFQELSGEIIWRAARRCAAAKLNKLTEKQFSALGLSANSLYSIPPKNFKTGIRAFLVELNSSQKGIHCFQVQNLELRFGKTVLPVSSEWLDFGEFSLPLYINSSAISSDELQSDAAELVDISYFEIAAATADRAASTFSLQINSPSDALLKSLLKEYQAETLTLQCTTIADPSAIQYLCNGRAPAMATTHLESTEGPSVHTSTKSSIASSHSLMAESSGKQTPRKPPLELLPVPGSTKTKAAKQVAPDENADTVKTVKTAKVAEIKTTVKPSKTSKVVKTATHRVSQPVPTEKEVPAEKAIEASKSKEQNGADKPHKRKAAAREVEHPSEIVSSKIPDVFNKTKPAEMNGKNIFEYCSESDRLEQPQNEQQEEVDKLSSKTQQRAEKLKTQRNIKSRKVASSALDLSELEKLKPKKDRKSSSVGAESSGPNTLKKQLDVINEILQASDEEDSAVATRPANLTLTKDNKKASSKEVAAPKNRPPVITEAESELPSFSDLEFAMPASPMPVKRLQFDSPVNPSPTSKSSSSSLKRKSKSYLDDRSAEDEEVDDLAMKFAFSPVAKNDKRIEASTAQETKKKKQNTLPFTAEDGMNLNSLNQEDDLGNLFARIAGLLENKRKRQRLDIDEAVQRIKDTVSAELDKCATQQNNAIEEYMSTRKRKFKEITENVSLQQKRLKVVTEVFQNELQRLLTSLQTVTAKVDAMKKTNQNKLKQLGDFTDEKLRKCQRDISNDLKRLESEAAELSKETVGKDKMQKALAALFSNF
eukprot:GILJ01024347.1.p1 GENE.GILJ01024347.1~~GILJ01024347.1.p1  ORF type:complete len:934 (+),score=198.78 GILJ01024347.1:104-2803(+)